MWAPRPSLGRWRAGRPLVYVERMTSGAVAPPDWHALEERLVAELRSAVDRLVTEHGDEPIAAIVLWADPYKGWYEVVADTAARNAAGARARNRELAELVPELAAGPEAWRTARTDALRTQASTFDPRHGDYALAEGSLHEFTISLRPFLDSPAYAALNVGGEDGWLEGHVRYVIAQAILRLVAAAGFARVHRAPALHVGYAYPDSGDAIIVAVVDDDEGATPAPPAP